ncbi:MAG: TIM barrel protein [Firmicutes bacterium]|nr:TIM barrel protein [Bacillota bacterium]
MEFGLFTCGYQRRSLEDSFADAAAFGYDYIELWGGRPHGYAPDLMKGAADDIRRLSEKYRIPVRIFTPEHNAYPFNYMMGNQAQWEDSIQYLKTAIRASALIGAEAVLLSIGHSGGLPQERRQSRLLHSLHVLSEEACNLGQTLLLENLTPMESDGYTTLEDYADLFKEDLPCIKAMCDVVVPFVQGEDPAEYRRILGPKMQHLHLTDSNGVDESHILPRDGIMDLRNILQSFRSAGYDGTVTIELVTNYMDDPTSASALAIRRIKELL